MIKLGIVGVGKIVRDAHLPALAQNGGFELVATASRHQELDAIPAYRTIEAMLDAHPQIDAVALCMPPQYRFAPAMAAIRAGKHVLLEKPPGASVSEIHILAQAARERGVSVFASWHSRFAASVAPARQWLAGRDVEQCRIIWKEDVRKWHPGQDWIWEAGGMGVFDPGINALSIMTEILPFPVFLTRSDLEIPRNRAAPIAAQLSFSNGHRVCVEAEFDWRHTGTQTWNIEIHSEDQHMVLSDGGVELMIDGQDKSAPPCPEYEALYAHFSALIQSGESDVDLSPLCHVSDAFLLAKTHHIAAFDAS